MWSALALQHQCKPSQAGMSTGVEPGRGAKTLLSISIFAIMFLGFSIKDNKGNSNL